MKEKTLECICHRDTGVLALLINLLEVMQICKSEGKLRMAMFAYCWGEYLARKGEGRGGWRKLHNEVNCPYAYRDSVWRNGGIACNGIADCFASCQFISSYFIYMCIAQFQLVLYCKGMGWIVFSPYSPFWAHYATASFILSVRPFVCSHRAVQTPPPPQVGFGGIFVLGVLLPGAFPLPFWF